MVEEDEEGAKRTRDAIEIWTRQREDVDCGNVRIRESPGSKCRSEWGAMKQGAGNRKQETRIRRSRIGSKNRKGGQSKSSKARKVSQKHASAKYKKA